MPPIDQVIPKAKNRVRPRPAPAASHPRPQGMSHSFTPSGAMRPTPRAPAPPQRRTTTTRSYTLPSTYHSEAAVSHGYHETPHQRRAIKQNLTRVRRSVQRTQRINQRASAKFGVQGQLHAEEHAKKSLALLYMSDPKRYQANLKAADDNRKGFIDDIIKPGAASAQKALNTAARGTKSGLDWLNRHTNSSGQRSLQREGLAPDPTKIGKEAADLVATTPASIYMTGAAVKEAASGDPKRLQSMWKDFKKTSAIPPLVTGHLGEAAKRANERPLTTALELSGVKAAIGRGSGMAARAGVAGKAGKEFADTTRAPKRLYEGSDPGEGPAVARRYSKDLIDQRVQKAADKHKARKGVDPHTHHERQAPIPGGKTVGTPDLGPMKHPLDDRVDRHVHAMHVMQEHTIRVAERKARKRGKATHAVTHTVSEAQRAKEYTVRNPRVQGLDPAHVAHQAHDVLRIKKPVVVRLMTAERRAKLTQVLGKEPRGYTTVHNGHYKIEINPHHPANKGPKGLSNVMHYELGRVHGEEKGIRGPGMTGSRNRDSYFNNPNTKHASDIMRRHIGTDLRLPPPSARIPELQYHGAERPTNLDVAGQRAAQAAQQTHLRKVANDFAIKLSAKGPVTTHMEAMAAKASEERRLGGLKLVPVNLKRLTRMPEEPVVPRSADPHRLNLGTSMERAWRQSVEDHRDGDWVLMPERVVNRFVKHAQNSGNYGALQRTSNQFKDVVLTTANPVRWLGGNVTDLAMRSMAEGLTPADVYRGARVHRELTRHGRRGELIKASTMGGGFGHLARDVNREVETPGVTHLAKLWGHYRAGVYGIESAIESLPQMATVGKEMRMERGPANLRGGLKGLLRATDDQVQHFSTKMVVDPATEMRVAKHVEDVIGKWGKLSPGARRMLAGAPFAQWLGASTKYVLITLPTKHPIKTGILAAISQMTEKERQALGLSRFLPLEKQAQDYQMMTLPQHVGKDKYGTVVKGTDLSRALSFGTVNDALALNIGSFLLPQFSGALEATNGTSWTGEPLVYPEGTPHAGMPLSMEDKRKVALGMLIESMVPGASAFRRVVQEKGQPSLPQSTILEPQVRQHYDPKLKKLVTDRGTTKAGLKKIIGSPIPGLPQQKQVYTKGAINHIDRSRIAAAENRINNAKRAAEAAKRRDPEINAFGSGGHSTSKDPEIKNLGGSGHRGKDPEVDNFR
jgi:hypothetical protein